MAEQLNLLIAYPYMTPDAIRVLSEHQDRIRFVLDSGAFTAWKAGKPIALDDYCRFLETLPVKPWRYFSLDVIGDPHGTLENYETMLKRGFKPVPIFTRGEDPSVLDSYYNTSDVVGIGGLVGTKGNKGFVKGIMRKVGQRRCHWLGFTSLEFLKAYRPYMADSSTWEMGARYARCPMYYGGGKVGMLDKSMCVGKPVSPEIENAVARLGLDPRELSNPDAWQGCQGIARRLGAASAVKLSLDVGQKLGTHLFMAAATGYAAKMLLDAFDRIQAMKERKAHGQEGSDRSVGRNGLRNGARMGEVPAGP